jgi:hypothetical protein
MHQTAITDEEALDLSDFQPLAEFVQSNPHIWPTMQSAYWAINNSKRNGLDEYRVIVKRNRKLLVVKPRAVNWILAGQR